MLPANLGEKEKADTYLITFVLEIITRLQKNWKIIRSQAYHQFNPVNLWFCYLQLLSHQFSLSFSIFFYQLVQHPELPPTVSSGQLPHPPSSCYQWPLCKMENLNYWKPKTCIFKYVILYRLPKSSKPNQGIKILDLSMINLQT